MNNEIAVQNSNKFIEAFKNKANETLVSYLGDENKVARFYSAMSMSFAANPKLKECTPDSLSTVFMTCAEVGLFPSNYSGECYVIPYNIKGAMTATFQMGYQGMVTLGYRAGTQLIDAHIVYENDVFEYKLGLNPILDHKPDMFSSDRGAPKGAYAIAILESGKTIFNIMSKADIFKHREKSQGKDKASSPWKPGNDPQLWMWKKTVLKQLSKLMPKSPIMQQAIAADTQGDIIDVTPNSSTMSDKDIAAYRTRLLEVEGYTEDELKKGRLDAIGRDQFDRLTIEEAELIEKKLKENRDKFTLEGE